MKSMKKAGNTSGGEFTLRDSKKMVLMKMNFPSVFFMYFMISFLPV